MEPVFCLVLWRGDSEWDRKLPPGPIVFWAWSEGIPRALRWRKTRQCHGTAAAARVALGAEAARGLLGRMRGPGSLMCVCADEGERWFTISSTL